MRPARWCCYAFCSCVSHFWPGSPRGAPPDLTARDHWHESSVRDRRASRRRGRRSKICTSLPLRDLQHKRTVPQCVATARRGPRTNALCTLQAFRKEEEKIPGARARTLTRKPQLIVTKPPAAGPRSRRRRTDHLLLPQQASWSAHSYHERKKRTSAWSSRRPSPRGRAGN